MIGQFDFSQKGWVSGRGRSAKWRDIPWDGKVVEPQFGMREEVFRASSDICRATRLGFMDVSSSTNTRSMIATLLAAVPCNHKVPLILTESRLLDDVLQLCALVNSFVFDYLLRQRFGGLSLTYNYLEPCPVPRRLAGLSRGFLCSETAALALPNRTFAVLWVELQHRIPELTATPWQHHWAITVYDRLRRRCMLDAVVAELYGLDYEDLEYILRDDPSDPKGFWRVDKRLPPEQRQTTLTLQAFRHLKEVGLERFCAQGWELPEYVTEFDRPGVKVWQPAGGWEQAWADARAILGEEDWARFIGQLDSTKLGADAPPVEYTVRDAGHLIAADREQAADRSDEPIDAGACTADKSDPKRLRQQRLFPERQQRLFSEDDQTPEEA